MSNKADILLPLTWVLCTLSAGVVGARVWIRLRLVKAGGWDVAFIVMAMLCAMANSAVVTAAIHHGMGKHGSELSDYDRVQASMLDWISQSLHVLSTNWGKVSVALLLVRIIQNANNHKYYFYAGMVLQTIFNVVCVYTIFGQCTPAATLWDPSVKGSCWSPESQRDYAFFQGSFSAFTDLVLAIYPAITIWNLSMPRKLKAGLAALMSLGVIAMIAAIVKTINIASLTARSDYTHDTMDLAIWACTEQYLIIIAACIPTLRPLVNQKIAKRLFNSSNYVHGKSVSNPKRSKRLSLRGNDYDKTPSDPYGYPLTACSDHRSRTPEQNQEDPEAQLVQPPAAAKGPSSITKTTQISQHFSNWQVLPETNERF
ncbi:Integral membrane protein [Venustampulla echinocandica]|uniref:Integral membrane protein n=1 Tax=Venustampulla echinocandica TaxID=2656787 RepID=A0A370TF67_9HELO|nr:Integral membrane protein [Venustampulla echinocandica]RDL33300.1 Integral membrane protein [Venustampulla echinocandica]